MHMHTYALHASPIKGAYICTIYTYMHHMHHKKHTFVHRCTLYTYMHCIHIHAPQNTCVHYTYMYHMHTCASYASPIKGSYFCTMYTYMNHMCAQMHHIHIHAPHAHMCTTCITKHRCTTKHCQKLKYIPSWPSLCTL